MSYCLSQSVSNVSIHNNTHDMNINRVLRRSVVELLLVLLRVGPLVGPEFVAGLCYEASRSRCALCGTNVHLSTGLPYSAELIGFFNVSH